MVTSWWGCSHPEVWPEDRSKIALQEDIRPIAGAKGMGDMGSLKYVETTWNYWSILAIWDKHWIFIRCSDCFLQNSPHQHSNIYPPKSSRSYLVFGSDCSKPCIHLGGFMIVSVVDPQSWKGLDRKGQTSRMVRYQSFESCLHENRWRRMQPFKIDGRVSGESCRILSFRYVEWLFWPCLLAVVFHMF